MRLPRGFGVSQDDKCFACGRPFRRRGTVYGPSDNRIDYPMALTVDGAQRVFVGNDCWKKIVAAGAEGYQPPSGGPRLFSEHAAPPEVLAKAGITIARGKSEPCDPRCGGHVPTWHVATCPNAPDWLKNANKNRGLTNY